MTRGLHEKIASGYMRLHGVTMGLHEKIASGAMRWQGKRMAAWDYANSNGE